MREKNKLSARQRRIRDLADKQEQRNRASGKLPAKGSAAYYKELSRRLHVISGRNANVMREDKATDLIQKRRIAILRKKIRARRQLKRVDEAENLLDAKTKKLRPREKTLTGKRRNSITINPPSTVGLR